MPRRIGYLHAVGGIAIGFFFLYLGSADTLNEIRIRRDGIALEADVLNWRTLTDDFFQTSHEVQYTFTLPGDKNTYSRTDSTDRSHLWSTLPEKVWDQTKQTRKLSVVYLASNPKVNRPEQPGGFIKTDLFVAVFFGAILSVFSAALLFYLVLKQKRYIEL